LELLQAWNTGHPRRLTTIHANDPHAMLDRLCQLIEQVVTPAPRALVAGRWLLPSRGLHPEPS
jgi:type IV secretion system protein TrbB